MSAPAYIALTGNPNCGKTTVFNALTGLRAKVGNYAGVTVERKEGRLLNAPRELNACVLDLPGTYSLSPQSLDEQIARDVLLNRLRELPAPALVVVVVDASNLQRNLYYATQVIELGYPTLIALNMIDVAENNGHHIASPALAERLGVRVCPMVASSGEGIAALRQQIIEVLRQPPPPAARFFGELPEALRREVGSLADQLARSAVPRRTEPAAEALLMLCGDRVASLEHYPNPIPEAIRAARQRLDATGVDWRGAAIEARYRCVADIQLAVTTELATVGETSSDRLDRVLTHRVWGTLILMAVLLVMFQSIFTFARLPMEMLQHGVDFLGSLVGKVIPPGEFNSLVVDGIIAGVGSVVVFLPQILLLFLFIGFLEDTGYMARAAFLMDQLMSKVGLHGKSFIPMLSSFACAIPGIMATRTIESGKDRLVTIMIAPLMACSARLPVYTLLIAACIPQRHVLGIFHLRGLTLLGMYLLGIVVALLMAWLFRKTLLKGDPPLLIMELPPYKRPLFRVVARHMWDRAKVFVQRAGTVILGINILLWALVTYPRNPALDQRYKTERAGLQTQIVQAASTDQKVALEARIVALDHEASGARVRQSFAGYLGRAIEPVIAPLGFDWRIGIGIVTSFAAREVFVSTMSTVYNVGQQESQSGFSSLVQTLQAQRRTDGTPVYTALTGLTLMVFYVFALQCASTVVIVRRETNSWKWPLIQWLYMGLLAWVFAFVTWHGGHWLMR